MLHMCPGRCGREVVPHKYACPSCWRRLPRAMRLAIADTYQRDASAHRAAMIDAQDWYDNNRPPAPAA